MKRFYIIGFLILMSFDTLSQISFKYASTQALPLELSPDWLMRLFLNPWLYGAIAGYLGARRPVRPSPRAGAWPTT